MSSTHPHLSSASLTSIAANVKRPAYDAKAVGVGIVHISLGAFHRSHQAVYTDSILAKDGGNWGICGIGAMPSDKKLLADLKAQDHLYTVLMRGAETNEARIVGSLRETMLMPENPGAVIARLMDPSVKILSLTITEKGYCHDPQTGLLNPSHPLIAHDLLNPDQPQSAIGLIVAALKARKEKGMAPFTVMSCDNLPHNGKKAASIVTAYAKCLDEKLAVWIEQNVAFPNTMVDRITPVTTEDDKLALEKEFGYRDEGLVVCEPFLQWVLEDHFPQGRPAWEKVGAQFVKDVSPYELAKIRLLNVPHTIFAYPAYLMGFEWVSDGASDPLLANYVRKVMDDEITPTLPPAPGIELEKYKTTIIERFANPAIKDTWARICSDGSQKIANQLVPIARERFAKGQDANGLALLLGIWFRYLTGKMDNGSSYKIDDPMADRLQKIALSAGTDPVPFLAVKEIFGDDILQHTAFIEEIRAVLAQTTKEGVAKVIAERYKI
jgi:fructuronate reductase